MKTKEAQSWARTIKMLVGIRLALVSVVLGVGSLVLEVERFPFYVLISLFYLASIFYLGLLKTRLSPQGQIAIQMGMDLGTLFGILHFSGGVDSVFISLTLLPLIGAGFFLPWSWSMMGAILASLGYLNLVFFEYYGPLALLRLPEAPLHGAGELTYITFLRLLMFWIVTVLAAALAWKLRMEKSAMVRLKNLQDIILEQMGTGIITVNTKNEIIFVNKEAQKLIGAPGKELIGENWKPLFFFANANFTGIAGDEDAPLIRGYEVSLRRKDGTKIPIGFNVTPLKDSTNEYCGKVMIFRDLTRIKELERKKQQAERLAAIGEMAAGIAHEIRNPLASISGSVEVLMRKKAFDMKYGTLVDIILREAQRLNSIVENFLNYTRRPELERRWVDLDQVLEEVILLLRHNGKWGSKVEILKNNDLEGKTRFWFDPNQMKQVFYNLLLNACESMPEGGKIDVRMSETQDVPPQIRVEVADNGCGISDEQMPKIFTPFFTTKQTGSGIGLPIVHRIVQDHGGAIEVKSKVGSGSIFTVYLPRGEELKGAA